MLERYPKRTLQILDHAREEAYQSGQPFVQREQLFFGLIRDLGVASLLRDLGVDLDQVRSAIESQVAPALGAPATVDEVDVLPTAQQVFTSRAQTAASQLGHTDILPEHILVGFLLEKHGAVLEVLRAAGLDSERVMNAVTDRISKGG